MLDLETGTYYSLDGAAAVAWSLLERGASAGALGAALKDRYAGDPAAIDAALARFVAELAHEGLIEETADPPAGDALPAGDAALPGGARAAFPGLALRRYTDVQELLLIDPVHEVDDGGWPPAPPVRA